MRKLTSVVHSIIAACVPCIKHLIERALVKMGLISSRYGPTFYHLENHDSSGAKANERCEPQVNHGGEPDPFNTGAATSTEDCATTPGEGKTEVSDARRSDPGASDDEAPGRC